MRNPARRQLVALDLPSALNLVGTLLEYLSAAFLLPVAVALAYEEPAWPFLAGGAATLAVGLALERTTRGREHVGPREGFLVVALVWLLAAGAIATPYLLAGEPQLSRPVDAFFEAMSGVTTTGSSVLTDIPDVDRSLLMWRQFSQWIGGIGIVVLAIAVLPRLRVGGRQLFASEMGQEFQSLTSSIRQTARLMWVVYVGLTALQIALLTILGLVGLDEEMTLFEAVAHTFATIPTGGFSTRTGSLGEFTAASQWIVILFMVLGATSFVLMFRAARGRANPLHDEEFRLYAGVLGTASALVVVSLLSAGLADGEEAVRQAVFNVVSITTTTGFANADFALWTPLATMVLFVLMFAGGMALSTSGSPKIVRLLLLARVLRRELHQAVHPEIVRPVRFNDRVVDEKTVRSVGFFLLLYLATFALGALAIAIDSARAGLGVTPLEAMSAAAATLGNIGPGFGFLGPLGSFEPFGDLSKAIMVVLMWMGRLELVPVAVLATRAYWRG